MRRVRAFAIGAGLTGACALVGCRAILGIHDGELIQDAGPHLDASVDGLSFDGSDGSFDTGSPIDAGSDVVLVCEAGVPPKFVFVTSQTYVSTFGGLGAADSFCQGLAGDAGLGGLYKAWLSDDSQAVLDRFTKSAGPYVRVDGVEVAACWDTLVQGLENPIFVTERGAPPPTTTAGCGTTSYLVWTATGNNGTAAVGQDCTNWTAQGPGLRGGSAAPGDLATWSDYCNGTGSFVCQGTGLLYCFQQ